MKPKRRSLIENAILVVGEGLSDQAFLKHLKSMYAVRGSGRTVKVVAADGGCPYEVIRTAVNYRHADYTEKYVLLDSDIIVSPKDHKFARENSVEVLCSQPLCLEGLLLSVLGNRAPATSDQCKSILHPLLSGASSDQGSYAALFPKNIIDDCTDPTIVKLRQIMGGH